MCHGAIAGYRHSAVTGRQVMGTRLMACSTVDWAYSQRLTCGQNPERSRNGQAEDFTSECVMDRQRVSFRKTGRSHRGQHSALALDLDALLAHDVLLEANRS